MKTKLGTIVILCYCLLFSVFSCQKEITQPELVTRTPTVSIEQTSLNELQKGLPDNVTIELANPILNKKGIVPSNDDSIPIDYDACNYPSSSCFQLENTYQQLQQVANTICNPVKRKICCCFRGKYVCFIMDVSPTIDCPSTPIIKPTIKIGEEKLPKVFKKN